MGDKRHVQVVNAGTFGVVKLAYWKGNRVAVKTMEAEEEKKAFRNEVCSIFLNTAVDFLSSSTSSHCVDLNCGKVIAPHIHSFKFTLYACQLHFP